ncbi:MAG: chorismate mutase [Pseudomonadota bacterium]|nr:chorismate mutase [Pseudomonadota bacterium]
MTDAVKPPKACQSMNEVRVEIDRVDRALVDLLAQRWGYVDRMWEFKRQHGAEANVPWRNREVIEKIRSRAADMGLPAEMAEALWRQIIGWGIQYQDEKLRDQQT